MEGGKADLVCCRQTHCIEWVFDEFGRALDRSHRFRFKRKARKPTVPGLQISRRTAHLKLWQEWGRSLGLPVHWPLWPAPLPPLVGGLGLANAGPVAVRMPAVTSATAAVRNRRFLIEYHPLSYPPEFFRTARPGWCQGFGKTLLNCRKCNRMTSVATALSRLGVVLVGARASGP